MFVGFDKNETVAFHVLSNSIHRHSSKSVAITPLILSQLPMTREREPTQSTDFAFSRFLVPWLCGYQGKALFMDCDMLVKADIGELFHPRYTAPVSVVKHDYTPKAGNKFLGQKQTNYLKKNWSSVMLFNNDMCRSLTPAVVNRATGLYLHQFHWTDEVGELPKEWNHLVGEYEPNPEAKCAHFTLGTPCFEQYAACEFAQEWHEEKNTMNHHMEYAK